MYARSHDREYDVDKLTVRYRSRLAYYGLETCPKPDFCSTNKKVLLPRVPVLIRSTTLSVGFSYRVVIDGSSVPHECEVRMKRLCAADGAGLASRSDQL